MVVCILFCKQIGKIQVWRQDTGSPGQYFDNIKSMCTMTMLLFSNLFGWIVKSNDVVISNNLGTVKQTHLDGRLANQSLYHSLFL